MGPERGGEPKPVPPRGRYLDGFLQHRHPAPPGLHLLLSPSPEQGGPGPASVRVSATARRGPAPAHLNSQRPLPGQAAGREGTRPAECRVRPKLAAEAPERPAGNARSFRRKEPNAGGKQRGKPAHPKPGGSVSVGGVARMGTEIAERRRCARGPAVSSAASSRRQRQVARAARCPHGPLHVERARSFCLAGRRAVTGSSPQRCSQE